MRRLLLALLLCSTALVAACGGGGGGGSGSAATPPDPVTTPGPPLAGPALDLLYGYWGSCLTCTGETHAHVNMVMLGDFASLEDGGVLPGFQKANAVGINNVVLMLGYYLWDANGHFIGREKATLQLTGLFDSIRAANYLHMISAVYPIDEPDVNRISDEDLAAAVQTVRDVLTNYAVNPKVAVLYGCVGGNLRAPECADAVARHRTFPGIGLFDWVGIDVYVDDGRDTLGSDFDQLKAALRPDQRIILVLGGADPFRTAPEPFYQKAQQDSQVVAIIPFVWFDRDGARGIRSNGMASRYCATGAQVIRIAMPCQMSQ